MDFENDEEEVEVETIFDPYTQINMLTWDMFCMTAQVNSLYEVGNNEQKLVFFEDCYSPEIQKQTISSLHSEENPLIIFI